MVPPLPLENCHLPSEAPQRASDLFPMAAGVGAKRSRGEAEAASDGDATGIEREQELRKDNDSGGHHPSPDDAAAASNKKSEAEDVVSTPASEKTCVHEVAIPPGYAESLDESVYGTIHNPVYTGEMAREYPFTLDPFQQMSVACIERRESVLVSAHTSAGKTAVAEYAVALAFKRKQRVIYTSPLKVRVNHRQGFQAAKLGRWRWQPESGAQDESRTEGHRHLPSRPPSVPARSEHGAQRAVQQCASNRWGS